MVKNYPTCSPDIHLIPPPPDLPPPELRIFWKLQIRPSQISTTAPHPQIRPSNGELSNFYGLQTWLAQITESDLIKENLAVLRNHKLLRRLHIERLPSYCFVYAFWVCCSDIRHGGPCDFVQNVMILRKKENVNPSGQAVVRGVMETSTLGHCSFLVVLTRELLSNTS